ncbi:cytochrome P450 [Streptomyces sp. UNOB3_S3]|uniref:cytochrome P450 n=1 Tax=Streptomyces sp. UNOB3_S3 TaxID=2871682 RepID=UPI001E3FBEC0|nr:cytochrome P450 [Streptomyces sp. UNOB3_S3]MCC3774674.1 cytochrome P450 [Streptomyces sp. UNOB3_S3]
MRDGGIEVYGPELLEDPRATYDRLRREAPVSRLRLPTGDGAWLVTRYADVRALLRDPRLPSTARHPVPGALTMIPAHLHPCFFRGVRDVGAPRHTVLRALLSSALSHRSVERLADRTRRTAQDLVRGLARQRRADLVESYVYPLVLTGLCDLMGVPTRYEDDIRRWTISLTSARPGEVRRVADAAEGLASLSRRLLAGRGRRDGPGLLDTLARAHDLGEIDEEELVSMTTLLLITGHQSTVNLIGSVLRTLLPCPGGPGLPAAEGHPLGAVIEEILRLHSPSGAAQWRRADQDVEVAGTVLPAGSTVMLALASANRDPAQFPAPDRLDPGRENLHTHLGFGHGMHRCPGAALARSQALIATRTLLAALPGLTLADAGTVWRTAHQRGPARLCAHFGLSADFGGRWPGV